jgi:superfamily II DNA/RNA helicase
VGQQLEKAGYRAASLQGNLSQNKRQAALDGFRSGSHQILVATDIAARGIDISSISHVINYDMPDTTDAYTHRIGRTGRAAKTGDAFTFVTREDETMVRSIERVLGEKVERRTVKGFDYAKPAPARDAEFARPPREPQRRREQKKPEHPRAHAAAAPKQKPHHAQPAHAASHRTTADQPRAHQTHPAHEGARRGHATQHPTGSTVYKSRTHNPRTYR